MNRNYVTPDPAPIDRGVRYERVDFVLDALKQASARQVYLLSEQEAVE